MTTYKAPEIEPIEQGLLNMVICASAVLGQEGFKQEYEGEW